MGFLESEILGFLESENLDRGIMVFSSFNIFGNLPLAF